MSGHTMLRAFTVFILCTLYVSGWCLEVDISSQDASCAGDSDGWITLSLSDAAPGFVVKLYDKPPAVKQQTLEVLKTSDTLITFKDLPAKKYYISVLDSKNQYYQDEILIKEPKKITFINIEVIQAPSSETAKDGIITLKTTGGTEPLTFKWSEEAGNQKTREAKNLAYGIYRCEISDANNCGPLKPHIIFMKPKNE